MKLASAFSYTTMNDPFVILITGASGTGKTTLGRRLAGHLDLPFISRDDVKELLFDALGWSDRAWSKKLGAASYPLLYYTFEHLLQAGTSCVIESNFNPSRATRELQALRVTYPFNLVQIICTTKPEDRLVRVLWRVQDTRRHPGHAEYTALSSKRPCIRMTAYAFLKIRAYLRWRQMNADLQQDWRLAIEGNVIHVDTTEFGDANYHQFLDGIKAMVGIKISPVR
jgi:predicted kinase